MEGRRLLYDGEILHNDAQLSDFFERLKILGIYQDTLIVLLSDHGEFLGEHGFWDHHPPGYLQVTHVPLCLIYQNRFHEAKRISQTVQLIDVMPTILELAEVDNRNLLLHGDSLVDLIEGRRMSYWQNRISMSEEPKEIFENDPKISGSLFFHNWHLISSKSLFSNSSRLPPALRMLVFNYIDDYNETRMLPLFLPDLYLRYEFVKIIGELQSNNIGAWKQWTAGKQPESYKLDPDVLERLRDLGYAK